MAIELTPPAPANSSTPNEPSGLSDPLTAIQERILAAPYPTVDTAYEAEKQRRERCELFADFLGDRDRYKTCRLDQWNFSAAYDDLQRSVVSGVREYIENIPTHRTKAVGALLYGPPGTGKDHLATCIIRAACLDHGQTAKFINGVDWFGMIRDAMDGDGKSEAAMMRDTTRPDWLVLSDPLPPVGNLTTHQSAMLYRLMDARNSAGKPTIVTVNVVDGKEATTRMGGATWDRMKDGAWVFGCCWPSFRKPAREI